MSTKRPNESLNDSVKRKRNRKSIDLKSKISIINEYEAGVSQSEISRQFDLYQSTVLNIIRTKEKYREQEKTLSSGLPASSNRTMLMIKMERVLTEWIEYYNEKGLYLSQPSIRAKALDLFELTKRKRAKKCEAKETFCASQGWYHRYRNRLAKYNIRLLNPNACNEDDNVESELETIIKEGGYTDKQIFTVSAIGLLWKKMPNQTFLAASKKKESDSEDDNEDKLTLLLGGNVSGDFKIKPMLIHRFENPDHLGSFSKESLPVFWRFNKNGSVTKSLFEDWFTNCFCPDVKEYCKSQDIEYKVLLVMDSFAGYSTALDGFFQDVEVVCLPLHTNPPVHWSLLKAFYLRKTFVQALEKTTGENAITVADYWKYFNIKTAVENIKESCDEITAGIMSCIWKNIIYEHENDLQALEKDVNVVVKNITQLGLQLGFQQLHKESVKKLISEDHLDQEEFEENDDDDGYDEQNVIEIPTKEITLKELEDVFNDWEIMKHKIIEMDPNFERAIKVNKEIENAIACYGLIYNEKKKNKSE